MAGNGGTADGNTARLQRGRKRLPARGLRPRTGFAVSVSAVRGGLDRAPLKIQRQRHELAGRERDARRTVERLKVALEERPYMP